MLSGQELDRGLDAGMMKGGTVQVSDGVGGFAVDSASKTSIRLSGHLDIKKRNAAISFLFHCELDAAVKRVEVFQEEPKVVLPMLPDYECVVHIPEPNLGLVVCSGDGGLFKSFHEQVCQNWGYRRSHGGSSRLFEEFVPPPEAR